MNKYEKHLIEQRTLKDKTRYYPETNSRGGWDEPVCGACALAAIQDIGRCYHIETLAAEFIPYHTLNLQAFYSTHGTGLTATHMQPVCGHTTIPGVSEGTTP